MSKDSQHVFHCKTMTGKIMKNTKVIYSSIFFIASLLIVLASCVDYEEPDLINDPNISYSATPVINSVNPPDSAVAGVRTIILNGSNFAVSNEDTNWVYIGGVPASVRSVTSDQIIIDRPAAAGENLNITVVKPTALGAANIEHYKIEDPVVEFGDFARENYDLMAIEVDANENLYIATRRSILKLTPDGINLTEFVSLGSAFSKFTDLKFGPEGYLYAAISKDEMYRIDPVSGADEEYVSFDEKVEKFDFDENNNIYAARDDGLFVCKPDRSFINTGLYVDLDATEIRVYNGDLYYACETALYKNPILDADGNLGATEVVLDVTALQGDLAGSELVSFNIDINGMFILCLKGDQRNCIYVLENDGSVTPYYTADILPPSVDQLVWGSSRYLYLNRGLSLGRDSLRLYRMGMATEGAPYVGRR